MSSEGCPALFYYWMQGAGVMYLRVPLRPLQVQHGMEYGAGLHTMEDAHHRPSPNLRWGLEVTSKLRHKMRTFEPGAA